MTNRHKSKLKKRIEEITGQPLKTLIRKYYRETGSAAGVAKKLHDETGEKVTPGFVYYWMPILGLSFERGIRG
jgi:hypothetical protein